jgi:uncharacterized protein YbaR (Trm112 family)
MLLASGTNRSFLGVVAHDPWVDATWTVSDSSNCFCPKCSTPLQARQTRRFEMKARMLMLKMVTRRQLEAVKGMVTCAGKSALCALAGPIEEGGGAHNVICQQELSSYRTRKLPVDEPTFDRPSPGCSYPSTYICKL